MCCPNSFLSLFPAIAAPGPMRVFETEDGAQERKLMGGTQRISDKMHEELKGDATPLHFCLFLCISIYLSIYLAVSLRLFFSRFKF